MLITVVAQTEDFYKQIKQIIPSDYKYKYELISPGENLEHTKIIITDGSDPSVYEEGIPVFVIADKLPSNIRESASVRLYQRGSLFLETFVKDVTEWAEVIEALEETSNKTIIAEKREKIIYEKLKDYENNLNMASRLQKSVMTPTSPSGFDISTYYQPISSISGDILIIEELGDRIYVIVGDVTDHGYLAGLYGASLYSLIKGYLALASPFNLSLKGLVEFVQYSSSFYQPNGYDAVRQKTSATMLFCEIDKKEKIARFINCGHGNELPVLVSKGEAILISFNQEDDEILPAIGDFTSVTPTKIVDIPFSEGDCLVFYTDGITEIFKDINKKKTSDEYSAERLLSSVNHEISKKEWSVDSIVNGIRKDAESYSISSDLSTDNKNYLEEAADDITILAIKWQSDKKGDTHD